VRTNRNKRRVSDPVLALAIGMFALILLSGFLGPLVWTQSPIDVDISSTLNPPSFTHPMGTDDTGRDVFARFLQGAQISILLGLAVVAAGVLIGTVIGLLAGMLGGWIDAILMRVMDAVLAFPALILAMAITIALGASLQTAAVGVVVSAIPWYARVVRSETLRLKSHPTIEAAEAIGATPTRIVLRHILPHLAPTVIVQAASAFGAAILGLAALGFIGLGAQIPVPEWGAMITSGLQYTLTGQWWIGVFPGIGLLLVVVSAGIIADRLRDHLDPRSQVVR